MHIFTARLFRSLLALIATGILYVDLARAASLSVTAGQSVNFTVSADGTQPFTYQWRKNGTTISGATSASFSIASATTADAASYSVIVANPIAATTSDAAVLTVNTVVLAPTIANQPASLTVIAGKSASFSVAASGTGTFSYQWRKNGTAISGATSATYTIAATTTADAASYSVVVTNSAGSVTSSSATLTVSSAVIAPTIVSQPTSLTVTAGKSASFSVTASGTATLSYQWRKNGTAISGATSAAYSIAATTTANAASYSVVVTNSVGSATSGSATLTVVVVPTIASQPASLTVTAGQSASFSVAASGTGNFTYQWCKNGTAISGATSATYTIAATTSSSAGSYSVVVTNSAGAVSSNAAVLSITAAPSLVELTPKSFSARGQNGPNQGIAQLFDGLASTKWYDPSPTSWVQLVFASPSVLQAYSLTSADDAPERDPASWTLSGSNDGITWTVIEKRTTQSWSSRLLARDFVLASPTAAYSQFRFDFQATSGSVTQLAELELFGPSVISAPATVGLTPSSYSARGQNAPNQGIAQLFDGLASTKWYDPSPSTWVQVNLATAKSLQVYSLTSADDAPERDPASWTLSGSNDGIIWTVIEKRTAQSWTSRLLARDFVLATPSAAYSHFRFDFQATSGSVTQLAELELLAPSVSSAPATVEFVPSSFSARGQNAPNQGIAQLFDGLASTKWYDPSPTTWVQVNLATAKSLQVYSLTSADDAPERDPASWTLSGSNDGVIWTVIEKRTGQSWSSRLLTRSFVLAAASATYSHFRFDFQATSGSTTQLAELELSGTP